MSSTALLEQGSPEWRKARAEYVTGTATSVLERINQYQKPHQWLRETVRALAGVESEVQVNQAMQHGTDTEPEAVEWYESTQKTKVRLTGLVKHQDHHFLAASPDGLVGLDGAIEIKCPYSAKTPYSVWDENKAMYLLQCHHIMECCDLEWIDFVCYIKRYGTVPLTKIDRVQRREGWLEELLDGGKLPVPQSDGVTRLDLYQAWHNHAMAEFQDPKRCAIHTRQIDDTVHIVKDDEELNQIDDLRVRADEIETEIGPQLDELSENKKQQDELKKVVADRYTNSVSNGFTLIDVVQKTPPIDYKKAFGFLGGEQTVIEKGESMENFRRQSNARQISIKTQGD